MANAEANQPSKEQIEAASSEPLMTVLTDGALEESDWTRDRFGLHQRLAAVYDVLRHRNTVTPIAIALYGGWGTGKTSAMKWLDGRLQIWNKQGKHGQHKKVRTVWFYPWKYHSKEDVWRGLIAEVVIHTLELENVSSAHVVKAAKEFGLFLGRSFLNVLRSIKPSGKVNAGVAEAGLEIDLGCIERMVEDWKKADHPEIAFLNEFEESLRRWVGASLGEDERMAIFIDDLDRCLPEVALQVLEALKLYLRIPNLIFVIGVDRQIIEDLVGGHYESLKVSPERSRDYLAKMFQVEVNISPNEQQIEGYLDACLSDLDKCIGGQWTKGLDANHREILTNVLRNLAEANPREVKRLLNSSVQLGFGRLSTVPRRNVALRKLAFAQGVQAALLGRILDMTPGYGGADMLRFHEAQEFLSEFSQIAQSSPDVEPPVFALDGSEIESLKRLTSASFSRRLGFVRQPPKLKLVDEASTEGPYSTLIEMWRENRHFTQCMWQWLADEEIRQLLRIPFSAEAAEEAAAASTQAQTMPRVQLPDVIANAAATKLKKKPETLTVEDLAQLNELNLSGQPVTDDQLGCLPLFKSLEWLYLNGTGVTDAGLVHVRELKGLVGLLLGRTHVTDLGLEHLKCLENLAVLIVDGLRLTDAGLVCLKDLKKLRGLSLEGTALSDASLALIAEIEGLRSLWLSRTGLTDDGLDIIGNLSNLEFLDVSDTRVTDVGLAHLNRLRLLETLWLHRCNQVTDTGLERIGALSSLASLSLDGTSVTDVGLLHLKQLNLLVNLGLSGTGVTDEGLVHLKQLKSLRWLTLKGCKGVTDAGKAMLEKALPECKVQL